MKKIGMICLTVLLCGMMTLPAGAMMTAVDTTAPDAQAPDLPAETAPATPTEEMPDGSFATAIDLYEHWMLHGGYPDYLCGVWTDNGTTYPITFSLTKNAAGEAARREILRLLADDNSVNFAKAKYSYRELAAIQNELLPYMGNELGFVGCGVYEKKNRVEIEIYLPKSMEQDTRAFVEMVKSKYGDRVLVNYCLGYSVNDTAYITISDTANSTPDREPSPPLSLSMTLIGCLILALTAGAVLMVKQRRPVVAQGVAEETAAPHTRRSIEVLLKNGDETPPSDLEDKILKKLK